MQIDSRNDPLFLRARNVILIQLQQRAEFLDTMAETTLVIQPYLIARALPRHRFRLYDSQHQPKP